MTNLYPYRSSTTPPIAAQDDPRYETPGGAQEKVDAHISQTFNLADRVVTQPKIAYGAVGGNQLDPALLQNYGDIAVQGKFQQVEEQFLDIEVNVKRPPAPLMPANSDGTVDAKAIIQAIIDYVDALGGGRVYFPRGTYLISGELQMKPKVFLCGTVPGNVFYDKTDKTSATIMYSGSGWAIQFPESPNSSQSGIINLNIVGNTSALGGININTTLADDDPSLDLYFSGVCVAYFPNGYGMKMRNTYRNALYSVIIRQCGCGFSTLDTTNDLTIVDMTLEWCALGASFVKSTAISLYGLLAEGLGVRPDVNLPPDLFVWTDYGRNLDYYHGGIRNFGSTIYNSGGYIEHVNGSSGNGDIFIQELGSIHSVTGMYIECSSDEGYIVNKTNGATSFVFTGNRIQGSPSIAPAAVNLDNAPFNCFFQGNGWTGAKTVPFFENVGDVGADGGVIQAPDDAARTIANYGTNVFAPTTSANASIKLLGSYTRSALDNYWEWYRQDGDGTDRFSAFRRKNSGVMETILLLDGQGVHPAKPLVFDNPFTAAAAPQNGMFKDSADGKLKFKDGSGAVHDLY